MKLDLAGLSAWKPTRRTILGGAAASAALAVAGCGGGTAAADVAAMTIIEAYLNEQFAQIGGATTAVAPYTDASGNWVLFSMANRFAATKLRTTAGAVHELPGLPGAIVNITVLPARKLALLSMGNKGIGVVNIEDPTAMEYVGTIAVRYTTPAIEFADGGGNYLTAPATTYSNGTINDVLVYNDGTTDQAILANADFGLQRITLTALLDGVAGSVAPTTGAWTLMYAGENPWGGPRSLKMHEGRLYAALGFLGIGIYDPATLARSGKYNLYADNSTREDWFGFQNEKAVDLLTGEYIDADGMPTWQQAARELQSHRSDSPLDSYPWAAFDRYGKYYYQARTLDIVTLAGMGDAPARTMAYIAYGLGGLVAVDVTDPAAPRYQGFVPAVPAHGPDEPTGSQSKSILSHHGSGMLEEAGVAAVRVVEDAPGAGTYKAFFSEHFAGLVVAQGAENPQAFWKGPSAPYNNDTKSEAYWPDYEFVTSYDMTPVPVGDESLPRFLVPSAGGAYPAPVLLATGEINGHGGALFMAAGSNTGAAGQVDIVQSSGAGGVSFLDIVDLATPGKQPSERFSVVAHFASTGEVGAAPEGSPTEVAIGHTEGLAVQGNYLFVGDGPHGMSVWRIANGTARPIDDFHLVANTLMDEYPVGDYTPTPHAAGVYFGDDPTKAYVMCASLGMRRVDVSDIGTGAPGTPVMLNVAASDVYEHSGGETDSHNTAVRIHGQDHAYGATFHGKYAIVADGGNGITVYDTSVAGGSGKHVVANLGGTESGKPPLGRATAVKLWTDSATSKIYAVVAAGPYGVSVVDMTELLVNGVTPGMTLIKTFEPIKLEEEEGETHVGSADGKSVDVQIGGDVAYISYDSFGIVAYRMADLIQPLAEVQGGACAAVPPTKIFDRKGGLDCRPVAAGHYKLQADPAHPELADVDGGAQYMTLQYFPADTFIDDGAGRIYKLDTPRVLLYVAYAQAGVIKLDWSKIGAPKLLQRKDTVGKAVGAAIGNGRVYVADYAGGIAAFR